MAEQEKERTKEENTQRANRSSLLAEKSRLLFGTLLEKRIPPAALFQMIYFNQIYQKFLRHLLTKPDKLLDLQVLYWQELYFLWQRFMQTGTASSESADQQFQNEAWQQSPLIRLMKDFYLMQTRHFQALLTLAEDLEIKTEQQIKLYLKKITEAVSPVNEAAMNPDVWQTTFTAECENLLKGLDKVLNDLIE